MAAKPSTHPLTPVVFHVLLALREGPLHGYAVMKRVEEDSGLTMGPGTIYGALQRLQDAGWVAEAPGPSGGEDPRRGRVFTLGPPGREALRGEASRITRLAGLPAIRGMAHEGGGRA